MAPYVHKSFSCAPNRHDLTGSRLPSMDEARPPQTKAGPLAKDFDELMLMFRSWGLVHYAQRCCA